MKKHVPPLALMALAALSMASPQVQAASASASLSNVYIQLFDLDPLDGVTPSLTFSNTDTGIYGLAQGGVGHSYNDTGALGSALANAVTDGGAQAASAILAGNLWLPGSGIGAQSSATALGLHSSAYGQGKVLDVPFTVSAKTLVVVTASAQASAAASLGEAAAASAYVSLEDFNASNYSIGQVSRQVSLDGSSSGTGGPLTVQASFVNLAGSSHLGHIYAVSYSSVTGLAAVPEPAACALMLAGILALGWAGRGRRRG